jgi:hypothetical protein
MSSAKEGAVSINAVERRMLQVLLTPSAVLSFPLRPSRHFRALCG